MTYFLRRAIIVGVALFGLMPMTATAQDFMSAPSADAAPQLLAAPPQGQVPPGQPPAQAAPAYTQQQIDQLLAPIALYPDPLVAQILMASTYPLEVVDAHRWLQNPQNAALKGDQLQAALAQAPWDPSVKSLVAFPQVLTMMDGNLQWTEQLGDAFLAQQTAVSESVQHLRQMAQSAGNLHSTPQETVTAQAGAIEIEPPAPQTVYVPYYNPMVVYGAWPWVGYPPYYFPPPPGYVFYDTGLIGFGVGIVVADWLWGWDRWDWAHHRIDIDDHRWAELNRNRPGPAGGVWQHDADHRHGVPYHTATTRAQFGGTQAQARSNFRGYFSQPENRAGAAGAIRTSAAPAGGVTGSVRSAGTFDRQSQSSSMQPHSTTAGAGRAQNFTPQTRSAGAGAQRSAPMFESFSRGTDVHAQAARGASSRASMPTAAPAARSAPSGGGNRGGGDNRNR